MKHLLSFSFSFALVIAASVLPALAQDHAASAPKPAMAASSPQDCGKAPMKPHNHSADKGGGAGSPSAVTAPCAAGAAASPASSPTSKKKQTHDHASFHKNQ